MRGGAGGQQRGKGLLQLLLLLLAGGGRRKPAGARWLAARLASGDVAELCLAALLALDLLIHDHHVGVAHHPARHGCLELYLRVAAAARISRRAGQARG